MKVKNKSKKPKLLWHPVEFMCTYQCWAGSDSYFNFRNWYQHSMV